MTVRRLSPTQRTMLHNAIHGRPLGQGIRLTPAQLLVTSTALQARGMLDTDLRPTATGQAVFAPIPTEAQPC